jgi:hypothetical protein
MKISITVVSKLRPMYSPKIAMMGERSSAKPPRFSFGNRLLNGIMIGFTTPFTAS